MVKIKIVRLEIAKLFHTKIAILPMFVVLGVVISSLFYYGEFGYDWSSCPITYSEINGKFVSGQQGYTHNKEVADSYKGEVTEGYLEIMHQDYISSSAVVEGAGIYNSTYTFFRDIFSIGEEDYFGRDEVWGDKDGKVIYGFTGDWDAYGQIISNFFQVFTLFILVFASPLFTYERECGMAATIGTVKYGGSLLLKYKMRAVFLVVNSFLFAMLGAISFLHFYQYGFANADVSIQCSAQGKMVAAAIDCSMGELTVFRLLFGVAGCNMILLFTVLVSMLSATSLGSLRLSVLLTWIWNYSLMHVIIRDSVFDFLLALLPINALYIDSLVKVVMDGRGLCLILLAQIVLSAGMFGLIWKVWKKRRFYK